jgi:outer membrane protein insertion porin family
MNSAFRSVALATALAAVVAGCAAKAKPLPVTKQTGKNAPVPAPPVVDLAAQTPIPPCTHLSNAQPPADSPLLLDCITLWFHPISNQAMVEGSTYNYYIKTKTSSPTNGVWAPYNEESLQKDFDALYKTNFLDNLWIEVLDRPFPNGVKAKQVVFHMEERAKLKNVDYTGSKEVTLSKIDEKLKEKGIAVRLDAFVDQATIRRVVGVIRELYAEQGFEDAKVTTTMTPVAGGPKLMQLTFDIQEGPKIKIKQLVFDGNKAFSDQTLASQMKDNKSSNMLSFVTGAGKYQEAKFSEDALNIQDFYREHGFMRAQVGTPQIDRLQDSRDGRTRWVRVRVPVDEGHRYRMGTLTVTDNTIVNSDFVQRVFPVKAGEWINWKKIGKSMEQLKDLYSGNGYIHFTAGPSFDFEDFDEKVGKSIPGGKPIANITLHFVEGKQFLVNRITFIGNSTTHDTVARRELRIFEGGVFAMNQLKYSIRRLNQLGYFKPIESDDAVQIEETPGKEGLLDLKLKFQEQNRNQISFGAGASAIDGFFGQVSFQTSNFLGRGETLGLALQRGSQARNYSVSFSEPFLLNRPITAGIEVFSRTLIYPAQYTQISTGFSTVVGFPVADFTRLFMGYSLVKDQVPLSGINPLYFAGGSLNNPALVESLLLNEGGKRTTGKISPSLVFDTVRVPVFPDAGTRLSVGGDFAGIGGDLHYYAVRLEGTWFRKTSSRTNIGIRLQGQYIDPYGATNAIPIYQKYFLGGEYTIRGFDLRSISPRDPTTGIPTGGNKTILFNAEYVVNVGGPVRVLAFYDAGEIRDTGNPFVIWDTVSKTVPPAPPLLSGVGSSDSILSDPSHPPPPATTEVIARYSAIKTSTGFEVRFFMPVLNVPFRLIFAWNPQRAGVLTNNFTLTKGFVVRFAVGTTF